jgi:cysteine desulfurase/selenocysteine lyase
MCAANRAPDRTREAKAMSVAEPRLHQSGGLLPSTDTSARAVPALTVADVERIRHDFPILRETVNGHSLVYLDSGATSQRPYSVLDAEREFVEHRNSAVHRGAHTLAAEATELFENARATVATFVGVHENEIVWTSNATEAINLVAYAISNASVGRGGEAAERFRLTPGDEIVVTEMEHHANLIPWQELAARTGATLRVIGLNDDGALRMDEAQSIIGDRTRLVCFTHVSNVLGTVNPVAHLTALAHSVGALVVLDACQSAPHRPLDLAALDVDFAAFSGHKMLGPTGVGVLYGKADLLNALPPFLTGGSMITTVTLDHAEYLPAPQRFEAGTQRVSQAIALASAVDYLTSVGVERIHDWESDLGQRLVSGLSGIDGIRVLGPELGQERAGLASFVVEGVHSHDVGQYLDDLGIAIRVGHHCTQPLHRRFGVTATTRASAYLYTTPAEVDTFLEAVSGVRAFFGTTVSNTSSNGARK